MVRLGGVGVLEVLCPTGDCCVALDQAPVSAAMGTTAGPRQPGVECGGWPRLLLGAACDREDGVWCV